MSLESITALSDPEFDSASKGASSILGGLGGNLVNRSNLARYAYLLAIARNLLQD